MSRWGGTHRTAHADFPLAQGDADQDHVHDDDAANDNGDGANQDEYAEKTFR